MPLKTGFVVLGAFLLVFGGAMMYCAPVLQGGALYKAETSVYQAQSNQNSTSANIDSAISAAYNQAQSTLSLAETISLVGLVVAPIGAAVLAYGLVAGDRQAKVLAQEPTQS